MSMSSRTYEQAHAAAYAVDALPPPQAPAALHLQQQLLLLVLLRLPQRQQRRALSRAPLLS